MIIDYNSSVVAEVGERRGWFNDDQLAIHKSAVSSLCDRTGTIDIGMDSYSIDKIPMKCAAKPLDQICMEEAYRVKALNRPVVIYWSGGIDSTLALISLLKAGVPDITVSMTASSIMEYPFFYQKFIKDKLNVRMTRPTVNQIIDQSELMVTGEFGDQMSGSVQMFNKILMTNDLLTDKWQDVVGAYANERYIAQFEEQVKHAPFEIITIFDFLWWLNFSCKWQNVLVRMSGNTNPIEFSKSVNHFFRHEDFQQWAMDETNHRTLKFKGTPESYKHHMKDVIYDFTKDDHYRQNKLKIGSLRDRSQFLFKFDDGRIVTDINDAHLFDAMFIERNRK